MKISFLCCLFYGSGLAFLSKAQTNTVGFYDSVFVINHPDVTRFGDSVLTVYELACLKTLDEIDNELIQIRERYILYDDSLNNRLIYCEAIIDWEQVLNYKKQTFINDKMKIRAWFERSIVDNLEVILDLISCRHNLAYMVDKCRSSNQSESSLPDYTTEVLEELIRRSQMIMVID
jgi:hypothetical protein